MPSADLHTPRMGPPDLPAGVAGTRLPALVSEQGFSRHGSFLLLGGKACWQGFSWSRKGSLR